MNQQEEYLCTFESPTGIRQGVIKRWNPKTGDYVIEEPDHRLHKIPKWLVAKTSVTRSLLNDFLDTWWSIDPKMYHEMFEKHHGVGLFMWEDLRIADPQLYEFILERTFH